MGTSGSVRGRKTGDPAAMIQGVRLLVGDSVAQRTRVPSVQPLTNGTFSTARPDQTCANAPKGRMTAEILG